MRIEKAVGAEVLERMLSAYGFSMQKELAEHLGIAKSNVAGWVQRGQVPGNAIVQCALDTGADANWLVTGKIEKANFNIPSVNVTGKALYDEIMANGGKAVLRRILDAYGFTMQKQLCELLGISSGTVSTWVRRNYFPGEVVVTCAIDTGISLLWLALGKDSQKTEPQLINKIVTVEKKKLNAGILEDAGIWSADFSFFEKKPIRPILITNGNSSWLVDMDINSISNGRWLLGVGQKYDIYNVSLLPSERIHVTNSSANFLCSVNEVEVAGRIILTMECDN